MIFLSCRCYLSTWLPQFNIGIDLGCLFSKIKSYVSKCVIVSILFLPLFLGFWNGFDNFEYQITEYFEQFSSETKLN